MKNRLFEEHSNLTLEIVSKTISDTIDKNSEYFNNLDSSRNWSSIKNIFLEDKTVQKTVIDLICYIDEIEINYLDKISYIATLADIAILEKLGIVPIEESDLFLLISYLKEITFDKMDEVLKVINHPELLLAIRRKSLDLTERSFILRYTDNLSLLFLADFANIEEVKNFISQAATYINTIEYYELLRVCGYQKYIDKK